VEWRSIIAMMIKWGLSPKLDPEELRRLGRETGHGSCSPSAMAGNESHQGILGTGGNAHRDFRGRAEVEKG
jgi:hypothetical protein